MRILAVGVVTWDIILGVAAYPVEDGKSRALWRREQRGGNAANMLAVLSTAGHRCELLATLPEAETATTLTQALQAEGIAYLHCPRLPGQIPTSYVLQNTENGSRTIVHSRQLPELDFTHFAAVPLAGLDWLHCEGRQPEIMAQILRHAREFQPTLQRSVELEKPRAGLEVMLPLADTVFFSRHYVLAYGYTQAAAFLHDQAQYWPKARLFCAWGDQGAYAHVGGTLHFQPVSPVETVVESVGAGDVFNAAVIHALGLGADPGAALRLGCQWAGAKCAQTGFRGVTGGALLSGSDCH